ncbi:hypothetical protein NEMIN01_1172 [Nematocida minor]|uniref:uncharacterized protein n=1 Tax=Nematocida minor TaxID=1912983 RepID=UPI00222041A9|nr:uncharacterized protein NEMIN01_1172 [Nematocida minor]KAI5190707.1 hypothetical protein NEMIN01_1172 [Nematocida minor]
MGSAEEQEYSALIRKSTLSNKYAVKALQCVAETNEHSAKDIIRAINSEITTGSDENKEALNSLLRLLAQHPSYHFIREKEPKRRQSTESEPEESVKKRKVEEKEPEQAKAEMFFPYPPEYILFKMVDKSNYKKSYEYYTQGSHSSKLAESEAEPELTRAYLVVPRLEQAVRLLYTAEIQCKVCGMRFDSISQYTTHADMHQKKSQLGRSVEVPMWRAWLLEPGQYSKKEQKISVTLKTSVQGKVPTVPVRGDRDQRCTICGDGFDVIWSDENECWSFNDALIIRATPRQISHKRCVS